MSQCKSLKRKLKVKTNEIMNAFTVKKCYFSVWNRRVASTTWIRNYLPSELAKLQKSDAVLCSLHRSLDGSR